MCICVRERTCASAGSCWCTRRRGLPVLGYWSTVYELPSDTRCSDQRYDNESTSSRCWSGTCVVINIIHSFFYYKKLSIRNLCIALRKIKKPLCGGWLWKTSACWKGPLLRNLRPPLDEKPCRSLAPSESNPDINSYCTRVLSFHVPGPRPIV